MDDDVLFFREGDEDVFGSASDRVLILKGDVFEVVNLVTDWPS